MSIISARTRAVLMGAALSMMVGFPGIAHAEVDISNVPVFLKPGVDPNIMFILDDSGSMFFEVTPDSLAVAPFPYAGFVFPRADNVYGAGDYPQAQVAVATVADTAYAAMIRSSQFNTTYYDPSKTYEPWTRADRTLYPDASPTCARHNPENGGSCPTGSVNAVARNLTVNNSNYHSNQWRNCTALNDANCASDTTTRTFWPATYFVFNGGDEWTLANYERVEIRATTPNYTGHGRQTRTDCANAGATIPSCSYAEEIQNFANWYTYYRSRILASRAGIGKAFARQDRGMRVGYGAINAGSSSVDTVDTTTIVQGVRDFDATGRTSFFNQLYTRPIPRVGTPLRRALDDAGQYFSRADERGPWSSTPGVAGGELYECQQSYTILMTDGYWSGGTANQASTGDARDNVDGTAGPSHSRTLDDGTVLSENYQAVNPFTDGWSNTLADVAMYYWKRDLLPGTPNRVPRTDFNPAFWQHMVTYGVALGVDGSIDPDDAWAALADPASGPTINWPDPFATQDGSGNCTGTTCDARLDDLLHAAVNSRGGFFSASDPITFSDEFGRVLDEITTRVEASATSSAVSSAVLMPGDTYLFTTEFRSTDWSGRVVAYEIDSSGRGDEVWDAEERLEALHASGNRKLFTINSGTNTGTELDYASLSDSQKDALDHHPNGTRDDIGTARVDWLWGDPVAGLRSREPGATGGSGVIGTDPGGRRLLGDIINSSPQYMGNDSLGYEILPGGEGNAYRTFRESTTYTNRRPTLFVGANDGFLHAFDADTGNELFAFMPSELLLPDAGTAHARINTLMAPSYNHRYFVDGTVTVGDAYVDGEWKTILVGTMGAGGRTVFALDVTDPANFDETKILWEYTHPNLGYGVTDPVIARMNNGKWAAVFGNGYNSDSHQASLFIVPLDGSTPVVVNTGQGSLAASNGLAPVWTTDWPANNLSVQTVYAGDLDGRMWRFDVSSTNPNQWDNAGNRRVLFQAKDSGGNNQPITTPPVGNPHQDESDTYWVAFGTGSFFRNQDAELVDPQVQTFYGLKDRNNEVITNRATELVGQTIDDQYNYVEPDTGIGYLLRTVSENEVTVGDKGWYLDLIYAGNANGERVVSAPELVLNTSRDPTKKDRVSFSTLIPDDDICGSGRTGLLMDIDLASGGRVNYEVFDLNEDGVFDSSDVPPGKPAPSGLGFGQGEGMARVGAGPIDIVFDGEGRSLGVAPGGSTSGRQTWRQLR